MSVFTQSLARSPQSTWRRWMRRAPRLFRRGPWLRTVNTLLAKRIFDLTILLLVLPLVLVLMTVIAVAIYLDSGRPVLFVQDRAGKGGRRFRLYKFRTLRADYSDSTHRERMKQYVRGADSRLPDANGKHLYKPFDQTQVTRVGKLLRKTSLDELPQIWNVFLGQMSWIGPRPNVLWEVEAYYIWHTERLEVLPGITGLAQVRGRSGLAFDTIARYDIEYIRQLSLKLDLKIIWWTLASIVHGDGAG